MFQKRGNLLVVPGLYREVTVQGGLTSDLSLAAYGMGMALWEYG